MVKNSPRAFGALMAIGLGISMVLQAIIHMGVNVHLLPNTGITLPFISWGGSSIWFNSFALGIILSVSRHVNERAEQKPQTAVKRQKLEEMDV